MLSGVFPLSCVKRREGALGSATRRSQKRSPSKGLRSSQERGPHTPHRPLEMETASRRQQAERSAATRVWGPIGSAEILAEGTAYTTTK
jgi:hypothetical protein